MYSYLYATHDHKIRDGVRPPLIGIHHQEIVQVVLESIRCLLVSCSWQDTRNNPHSLGTLRTRFPDAAQWLSTSLRACVSSAVFSPFIYRTSNGTQCKGEGEWIGNLIRHGCSLHIKQVRGDGFSMLIEDWFMRRSFSCTIEQHRKSKHERKSSDTEHTTLPDSIANLLGTQST